MIVLTTTLPNVEVWVVVFWFGITLLLSMGDAVEVWLLAAASSADNELF